MNSISLGEIGEPTLSDGFNLALALSTRREERRITVLLQAGRFRVLTEPIIIMLGSFPELYKRYLQPV